MNTLARSLLALCTKPARSVSAACAQRAESVDRIFGNLVMPCLARSMLKISTEFFQTLACHAFASLALPWHVVPWPLHALCCLAMPRLASPCLALPCHAVGLACRALALALPHSRHFEKVRLLEAWHAYPCTQPARIMHKACAQRANSVGRIFRNLVGSLRAACAQHAEIVDRSFQTLSNPIFIEISPHNKLPIIKSTIFRAFSNLPNDF